MTDVKFENCHLPPQRTTTLEKKKKKMSFAGNRTHELVVIRLKRSEPINLQTAGRSNQPSSEPFQSEIADLEEWRMGRHPSRGSGQGQKGKEAGGGGGGILTLITSEASF